MPKDRWSVLIIFQAMDAAGKDGAIKHVMSGINPQGCQVHSFKAPSHEELEHDFLWRADAALPERGRIGIFNRSYYEEVLVVRVHPEILEQPEAAARARRQATSGRSASRTSATSSATSRATARVVLKFFLHVSKEEQKKRFLERIDEPEKNWKFSRGDVEEREHWDDYMEAYEDMIQQTATEARAVVCRAGRQQMVHAAGRLGGDRRQAGKDGPEISRDRRSRPEGNGGRACGADFGEMKISVGSPELLAMRKGPGERDATRRSETSRDARSRLHCRWVCNASPARRIKHMQQ